MLVMKVSAFVEFGKSSDASHVVARTQRTAAILGTSTTDSLKQKIILLVIQVILFFFNVMSSVERFAVPHIRQKSNLTNIFYVLFKLAYWNVRTFFKRYFLARKIKVLTVSCQKKAYITGCTGKKCVCNAKLIRGW